MNKDNSEQTPATPDNQPSNHPEWLSVDAGCKLVSIGRTRMYELLLLNGGSVRSVVIRKRGYIRGMRRIHTASLLQFMEGQPSE